MQKVQKHDLDVEEDENEDFIMLEVLKHPLQIVNDRSAKNQVRPNRTGSVDLTEGSAEPFGRTSAQK